MNRNLECFTIGHSNHETCKFVELLKLHNTQYVIDVRSTPYSQRNPQFNRELIKKGLERNNIFYIFLGDLLGARHDNPNLFFSGNQIVDFNKVRRLDSFKEGIDRVLNELNKGHRVVLMCSEKDPLNCHRFVLVSHELTKQGIVVKHILDDGNIVLNDTLEDKLISKYKLNYRQQNFFNNFESKRDAIEKGYVLRNKDIGYSKGEMEVQRSNI